MKARLVLSTLLTALVLGAGTIGYRASTPSPAPARAAELGKLVAEAVSNRLVNEMKARVLDPGLDETDARLLTDEEISLSPTDLGAFDRPFPRVPSAAFVPKVVDPATAEPRYRYLGAGSTARRDVPIDPSLAPPAVEVDLSDPLHPTARVARRTRAGGGEALYYFEFDTSPRFDSPNFWQYPALMPEFRDSSAARGDPRLRDLTGRGGLPLDIFSSTQRGVDGHASSVRFSFRATAMRLPARWSELSFEELERQALAVGYGLSGRALAAELYRYGRDMYSWGWDTTPRSPIEVFKAGIAECSANNNLVGAMLEMNGVRYRIVEGFNPRYRVIGPNGGHSAIEVLDPDTGTWSYLDSYLDLFLPETSAERLAAGEAPASQTPVTEVPPHHRAVLGRWITLGQLFRFRRYGDGLTRLPMTSMLKLRQGGGEREFGKSWRLNRAAPRPASELFPERQTIYVRARYVLAGRNVISPLGKPYVLADSLDRPVASPWGTASFEISPRALMARYPAPARVEEPNICAERRDSAMPLTGPFKREQGHAYLAGVSFAGAGDTVAAPHRSRLQLCEDGAPLGPAHSDHVDIRAEGHGRYSHWGEELYLSTSDNSDPNTNQRRYTVVHR